MNRDVRVAAVVVTYNRLELLSECINSLDQQSSPINLLVIVDNASTDGTQQWLLSAGFLDRRDIKYVRLDSNIGGAGGFAKGLKIATSTGADWVWMMDDDAKPQPDALDQLLDVIDDNNAIYGSIAVTEQGELCWPLAPPRGTSEAFDRADSVPAKAQVASLPFLGILIPATIVSKIGYPDPGYFIAGDDTEYCFRARACGIPIFAAGRSRIQHPASAYYRFGIGPFTPFCFVMPPWKRYYDVRNRILTMRSSLGLSHVLTRTVPATLLRLVATMIHERRKACQLTAYLAGIIDGVMGRKGMRHLDWRLPD